MSLLASLLLAVVALLLGFVGGTALGRRSAASDASHATSDPASGLGPPLADLLLRVLRSSEAGLAVLTGTGEVVLHNPRAADLGVVRAGLADPRARRACRQAESSGGPVEVALSPLERRGRAPAAGLAPVRARGEGCGSRPPAATSSPT